LDGIFSQVKYYLFRKIISSNFSYHFKGQVPLIVLSILSTPGLGTEDVANILDWILSVILPNYAMG